MSKPQKVFMQYDEFSPLFNERVKHSQITTPYTGIDITGYDNWVFPTLADLYPERMPALDWYDHDAFMKGNWTK